MAETIRTKNSKTACLVFSCLTDRVAYTMGCLDRKGQSCMAWAAGHLLPILLAALEKTLEFSANRRRRRQASGNPANAAGTVFLALLQREGAKAGVEWRTTRACGLAETVSPR